MQLKRPPTRRETRIGQAEQRGPITMKHVAQRVGVSQSTVSRVLSGATGSVPIAESTRSRVLQVATDLGYTPNPLARGLRGTSTGFIGILVPQRIGPFYSAMLGFLAAQARSEKYRILLGYAAGDAAEALDLAAVLETRYCDGLIVLGDLRDQPTLLEGLRSARMPLVEVCAGDRGGDIVGVNVDNAQGVRSALDHLWALGHREIAFVGGSWRGDTHERQKEFEWFMRDKRSEIPNGYLQDCENSNAAGHAAFARLLDLPQPPSAVVAASDAIAIGVLRAAAERGLSVPGAVSVVGFDGIALGEFTVPSLTTVAVPIEKIATAAVRELVHLLHDPAAETRTPDRIQTTLVVRESTGPARR